MTPRLILLATALAILGSCAAPPPPPPPRTFIITDFIPQGSRVEYFAQIYNDLWKPTMVMNCLPRPMHVKVAEKWALSAAQQRLGGKWKDYCFRVTPPGGEPVVIWQRRQHIDFLHP